MGIKTELEYSVHPGIEYARSCIRALEKRSGISLDQWVERAREGPEPEGARRQWLKEVHGLGTNFAWWITERTYGRGEDDTDEEAYLRKAPEYVDSMYSGAKAGLKPIHDQIIGMALELGDDVKVCPCQTIVPLYRNHVFAQIKPSTNKRIDLGFSLRGVEPSGRLLSTGGEAKGDRITHRIPLTSLDEIDDEVRRRLKAAYDKDA